MLDGPLLKSSELLLSPTTLFAFAVKVINLTIAHYIEQKSYDWSNSHPTITAIVSNSWSGPHPTITNAIVSNSWPGPHPTTTNAIVSNCWFGPHPTITAKAGRVFSLHVNPRSGARLTLSLSPMRIMVRREYPFSKPLRRGVAEFRIQPKRETAS